MPHELIELTKWPSMPAPFSSSDPGEAWVWGDYVALLQTNPDHVTEIINKITEQKSARSPMQYPYAMTVFYRKDRNPHGPSSRPIIVATLERLECAKAAKILSARGIDLSSMDIQLDAEIVQGLFTAEARANLGHYKDELTRDSARRYFLSLVKRHLSLEGEPVKIGSIADVHGHPNTGWPSREKKNSVGCLFVVAAFVVLIASVVIFIFFSHS